MRRNFAPAGCLLVALCAMGVPHIARAQQVDPDWQPGVYLVRLRAQGTAFVRRMVVIR